MTGAGGAAAVSFIQATADQPIEVFAGDIDPNAAGLYLVPADRRFLLPRGDSPEFAQTLLDLCLEHKIDVLLPTVDSEMIPVAQRGDDFDRLKVQRLSAPLPALELCLDKAALLEHCHAEVPMAAGPFQILNSSFDAQQLTFPVIAKPRSGSGSRGIHFVQSAVDLSELPQDGSFLVQEHLPGEEYSVDVLSDASGNVLAAVPRARMKVDSGIAVAARSLRDEELESLARQVAQSVGLTYVSNIQFKRDRNGRPKLLEINPRFPGTMPLTVASGVNMPKLSLDCLLQRTPAESDLDWQPLAMVRVWQEHFLPPKELLELHQADTPTNTSTEGLLGEPANENERLPEQQAHSQTAAGS